MATPENIRNARRFINQLSADGGTEMYQPLSHALAMKQTPLQKNNAIKQVLFITDGAVSNELSLFNLIKSTKNLPRLFTVGIGSAPNGFFMRKAAQFGQGSYTFIGNVTEVEKNMSILLDKISRPALTNINVLFDPIHVGKLEQFPRKIPDLYNNEPLILAFKSTQQPSSIQLFGDLANKPWQQEIALNSAKKQEKNTGISSIWAREKIESLLDSLVTGTKAEEVENNVIATSLEHQVMSPYTSFIAIEKEIIDSSELEENKQDLLKNRTNLKSGNTLQANIFPKTVIGWKENFIFGFILLILSVTGLRITKRSTSDVMP
jgi:Ca-activated chloride channel family protein